MRKLLKGFAAYALAVCMAAAPCTAAYAAVGESSVTAETELAGAEKLTDRNSATSVSVKSGSSVIFAAGSAEIHSIRQTTASECALRYEIYISADKKNWEKLIDRSASSISGDDFNNIIGRSGYLKIVYRCEAQISEIYLYTESGGTAVTRAAAAETRLFNKRFADLPEGELSVRAELLGRLGIADFDEGNLNPESVVMRREFAEALYKLLKLPALDNGDRNFTDVSLTDESYTAINSLAFYGVLDGIGEKFRPDDRITYGEAAAMIAGALNMRPLITGSANAAKYISLMQGEGIFAGISSGDGFMTRENEIKLLYNILLAGSYESNAVSGVTKKGGELLYTKYGIERHTGLVTGDFKTLMTAPVNAEGRRSRIQIDGVWYET